MADEKRKKLTRRTNGDDVSSGGNNAGPLDTKVSRRKAVGNGVVVGVAVAGLAIGAAGGYFAHGTSSGTTTVTSTQTVGSGGSTGTVTTTITETAAGGGGEPQSITINALAGFIESQASYCAAQYMKIHPGVKITVNPIPENNMNAETITGIQSGPPPDILYNSTLPAIDAQIVTPGYALNLDSYAANYGWDTGTIPYFSTFEVNKHNYWFTYGWIYYGNVYYNIDLFKKLSIPLPTDAASFIAAGQALTKAGYLPMAHGYETQPEWTYNAFSDILMNSISDQDYQNLWTYYGPNLTTTEFANRPIKWTDPEIVAAFQTLATWGSEVYAPGTTTMTDTTALGLFSSGKAGMYQIGSWGAVAVEGPVGSSFAWDFAPISTFVTNANSDKLLRISTYPLPYFVHYKTKSPNLCADFLNYFLLPSSQIYQLSAGGFLAFPIVPLASSISSDPNVQRALAIAPTVTGRYSLAAAVATQLHDPIEAQLASLLNGSTTPMNAANAIEQLAISINTTSPATTGSSSSAAASASTTSSGSGSSAISSTSSASS